MTLLTPWGEQLDRNAPLQEYPRMQLQRDSYFSLNGIWQYQINQGEEPAADNWREIVVPFAPGSALSGTDENLKPGEVLWYRRSFTYPEAQNQVILNFEAVDQCCDVFVNNVPVGSHQGGFAPFSLDITAALKMENELLVRVVDDGDNSSFAYGKQKHENGGMWYTPTAGIWQSVWIEELKPGSVHDLKITPDYDGKAVYVRLAGNFQQAVINVFENRKLVHRGITVERDYVIPMDDFHPWSPEDPFLYDLYIETEDETIKSYFGMRKFSVGKDNKGIVRFMLNNRPYFFSGLLDQGYVSDGRMTYPSEDALLYEIRRIKAMGFNMLRKHGKVECRRFYYLCDKYGLLVMQDMPNGGGPYDYFFTTIRPMARFLKAKDDQYKKFGRESEESRQNYYLELDHMLNNLYNSVCIFAWCPFNEAWGQFDSAKVTDYIRAYDTTRLIDSTSGWYDQGAGDFNSRHYYYFGFHVPRQDGRILILSEFGGYSYLEWGHTEAKKLWGYKKFKDKIRLGEEIRRLFRNVILANIPKGVSGCIYTQVSDVEEECNGLFTTDRKILKIDERMMRQTNEKIIRSI